MESGARSRRCGRQATRKDREHHAGRLNLTNAPGVYPIRIPVAFDKRAAANQKGKEKVSALCREVLASNKNAVVISNGAKGTDGVLNYQLAKGRNGLEDKDIYIVVTHIGPEEYAQLNVLGQWLGRSDVIEVYYSDQINQAVGRNRGFRDNGCDTKTVVITSLRLWGSLLKRFQSGATRTLLYEENIKPW